MAGKAWKASEADWAVARTRTVAYLKYKVGDGDPRDLDEGRRAVIEALIENPADLLLFAETMAHTALSMANYAVNSDRGRLVHLVRALDGPHWDEVYALQHEGCVRKLAREQG